MKYNVWFCSCGRIHVMPMEYLDWIQEDYKNRSVIQVCSHCGATYRTFMDTYEDGYTVCGDSPEDIEIFNDPNVRVLIKKGISVPLVRAYDADYHHSHFWWSEGQKHEVDTERFIHEVFNNYKYSKEEADEVLKSISGFYSGINWKGTKYAKEWED